MSDQRIWASVGLFADDPEDRGLEDRPHKVRLTIFSGPDFRTPHINVGRLFSNRRDAEVVVEQIRAACGLLCIPVSSSSGGLGGSLLRDVPEGGEYEGV